MAAGSNEYKDYKTAAQRHLMTCQYLVECLTLPDNTHHKPLSSSYKSYLLKNIYYLSGYTIESIINFAIYECVNDTKPRHQKIRRVNQLNEPSLSLAFKDRRNVGLRYVIAWHNFQKNMEVLNILATSKFSQIPVISGTHFPIYWNNVKPLFDNWEAQVRYKNNVLTLYTEQQILDFFKFSTELYTGIRSCITT
jgi:hypothetical protein